MVVNRIQFVDSGNYRYCIYVEQKENRIIKFQIKLEPTTFY